MSKRAGSKRLVGGKTPTVERGDPLEDAELRRVPASRGTRYEWSDFSISGIRTRNTVWPSPDSALTEP
jgi:hypothetical protein